MVSAISVVPSVELLSTTRTSVTRSAGRSARTRPMACASLCVGMITETRTGLGLDQPPRSIWPTLRQPCVDAPGPARASYRETKGCEDGNQQFPDPRGTPLRNPKTAEVQKRYKSRRTREQTDNEQNPERNFGQCLHRGCHRGMTGGSGHSPLPHRGRVTVLDVVLDQARVAGRGVKSLTEIFKENPNKHRANRHANQCQSVGGRRVVDRIRPWAHCRFSSYLGQFARGDLVFETVRIQAVQGPLRRLRLRIHEERERCTTRSGQLDILSEVVCHPVHLP